MNTTTPTDEVQVLVDLEDSQALAEWDFVRVILWREDGSGSTEFATLEHHVHEETSAGKGEGSWSRRILLRGEPIADATAIAMAKQYAIRQGIKRVFVKRQEWAGDDAGSDTVNIPRPKDLI